MTASPGSAGGGEVTISSQDFLWFAERALGDMESILRELGDRTANLRPDLPGANSPYAILFHCLGVIEYWAGHMVAGRAINRDREAEFRAEGPVELLIERATAARHQLADDLAACQPDQPLRNTAERWSTEVPFGRTQGAALFHLFEELKQHLGHMEISRDLLLSQQ